MTDPLVCSLCGRETDPFHPIACPSCVGEVRHLIRDVVDEVLEAHVQHVHHSPSSAPVMIVSPAASVERTSYLRQSATSGRLCRCLRRGYPRCVSEEPVPEGVEPAVCPEAAFVYETHRDDELHPSTVLQEWALTWSRHLEHDLEKTLDERDGRDNTTPTIGATSKYLLTQLTYMAQQPAGEIAEVRNALRAARAWLQQVLATGRPPIVKGEPCRACNATVLIRDGELWVCPNAECHQTWDDGAYRAMLLGVALQKAQALPADVLAETMGVKSGTLRQWAARGLITRHGEDDRGRPLYDVEQVRERIGAGKMRA